MKVKKGEVIIGGKTFKIGGHVIANKNAKEYEGLKGTIKEVLAGNDIDDNYGEDLEQIIVSFDTPKSDFMSEIEKRFSEIFQRDLTIDEIILDDIVCSSNEIDML